MYKKVFLLSVFISFQLGIFAQPALAAPSCKNYQIDWNPKIFEENATKFDLTLTISNQNTLNNLLEMGVQLIVDRDLVHAGWPTNSIQIPKDSTIPYNVTFSLPKNVRERGVHYTRLEWVPKDTSNWAEFCSDIAYQVGVVNSCTIGGQSIPSKIPPNTRLGVSFVGRANTEYELKAGKADVLNALSTIKYTDFNSLGDLALRLLLENTPTLSKTTTDSYGQGKFPEIPIPGGNGDRLRLIVFDNLLSANIYGSCFKDTTIDPTVSPPASVPAGPVQPVPAVPNVKQCPKEGETFDSAKHIVCVFGGGSDCTTADKRGPGIKTAIGCIHTSPVEFVKDFMRFIIAISGGIAFLMMLLGAYQMLASGGNPDSLNAGRERLTSAIIGLLFVIFAILFLQIIGADILNIPEFKP